MCVVCGVWCVSVVWCVVYECTRTSTRISMWHQAPQYSTVPDEDEDVQKMNINMMNDEPLVYLVSLSFTLV